MAGNLASITFSLADCSTRTESVALPPAVISKNDALAVIRDTADIAEKICFFILRRSSVTGSRVYIGYLLIW